MKPVREYDRILANLIYYGDEIDFVVDMPSGTRVQPEEIWIPRCGAWVRVDGSSASFDMSRGRHYYRGYDRIRLRAAIWYWNRQRQKYDRLCRANPDFGKVEKIMTKRGWFARIKDKFI